MSLINKLSVVPDFEQIPFHIDHICCPGCSTIQSARVLLGWPKYMYLHECVACGQRITEADWQSVQ